MARVSSILSLLIIPVLAYGANDEKLIVLTFDDGPRPNMLFGISPHTKFSPPGLLDLLDRCDVKATFFVMGWRLEKTPSAACRKVGTSTDCRQAAEEIHRRGHEIENHTFGHGSFKLMKERYGEEWVLKDIERASVTIRSITGVSPKYVRPPNWVIWQELRRRIESKGYKVMVKPTGDIGEPPITQDVDSEDYFCVGPDLSKCPEPSLGSSILRKIEERERRGAHGHILVFHELPASITTLSSLIPKLKARGYTFMRLDEYMGIVRKGAK